MQTKTISYIPTTRINEEKLKNIATDLINSKLAENVVYSGNQLEVDPRFSLIVLDLVLNPLGFHRKLPSDISHILEKDSFEGAAIQALYGEQK